jgi:hypothetical protein
VDAERLADREVKRSTSHQLASSLLVLLNDDLASVQPAKKQLERQGCCSHDSLVLPPRASRRG